MKNEDLFPKDQTNPYDTLIQLVDFADSADKHIMNLIKNQALMVEQYNHLKHELDQTRMRLTAWEAVVCSMVEDKDDIEKD